MNHAQLNLATSLPADILLEAVKEQAKRSIFSEAYCLELAGAYHDAAEIARERRSAPRRTPDLWDDSIRNVQ